MKQIFKSVTLVAALALLSATAQAGQRYGNQPRLVLSNDLAAPWVLQIQPGSKRNNRKLSRQIRQRHKRSQRAYVNQQRSGVTTASLRREAKLRGSVKSDFDPDLLPTIVNYGGPEAPGTIVVNTIERRLYLVEPGGKARRYAVGVGKPGFEWAGTHKVSRKAEWPSWRPPAQMIARERKKGRNLPTYVPGGIKNPLGARALYLGSSIYRIHGTNQAWSIGKAVSSGCIRMRNEDVMDLYDRVPVGARVEVI